MKREYDYEIALIMKKVIYENGMIGFVPQKVVEGYYDENEMLFIDMEGTSYRHIIDEPENCGYFERESFSEIKELYPHTSNIILKFNKLRKAKKSVYVYFNQENADLNIPIISELDIETCRAQQIFDGDIVKFYYYFYPDYFYSMYNSIIENRDEDIKELNDIKSDSKIGFDINKLYNEITDRVIGQDGPIREILEVICDQYEKEEDEKINNILINGDTGVGKTEIFRVLTKLLDVPCVITAATQYSGTGYIGSSVEDMLVSLVKKANGDIKKAQRGILIIDEIDKISETNKEHSQVNQKDVQEALLKILEDGVIPIKVGYKEYDFDASKLIVVGMGSWTRVEINQEKTLGFGKEITPKKTYKDITSKDMVENGMSRDLIGRFDVIIQMNDLSYDDYVNILKKSNQNFLEQHKKRLANKGVDLIISDELLKAIAKKAKESMFGARDLRKIIEKAVLIGKSEIRMNPNMYSELILTEDTLEDNKKYILRKKPNSINKKNN